jgi:hypothetical protein
VWPDAVFSGHVHNYQRFTRSVDRLANDHPHAEQKQIPYLIAGAGGFANTAQRLHKIQRDSQGNPPGPLPFTTTRDGVQLASYNDKAPGFLRVTVSAQRLTTEYFSVPFGSDVAQAFDSMDLDLTSGRIL